MHDRDLFFLSVHNVKRELTTWLFGALFKSTGLNKDKVGIINVLIGSPRYFTKGNEKWITEIFRDIQDSSDITDIIDDTHPARVILQTESISVLTSAFFNSVIRT